MSFRRLWAGSVVLSLFLVTAGAASGQVVCTLGHGASPYSPAMDRPPTHTALAEGRRMHRLLCNDCGSIMLVQNPTVTNAMLMSVRPGVSKLSYNPHFMNQVLAQYGNGATIGIIAHEIGHHVDFMQPAAWYDRSWGKELRADALAGCALARARIDPTQLKNALRAIAAFPSPSHPGWPMRERAVMQGYQQCGGTGGSATRPPRSRPQSPRTRPRLPIAPRMGQVCCNQFGQAVCRMMGPLPLGAVCNCGPAMPMGRVCGM